MNQNDFGHDVYDNSNSVGWFVGIFLAGCMAAAFLGVLLIIQFASTKEKPLAEIVTPPTVEQLEAASTPDTSPKPDPQKIESSNTDPTPTQPPITKKTPLELKPSVLGKSALHPPTKAPPNSIPLNSTPANKAQVTEPMVAKAPSANSAVVPNSSKPDAQTPSPWKYHFGPRSRLRMKVTTISSEIENGTREFPQRKSEETLKFQFLRENKTPEFSAFLFMMTREVVRTDLITKEKTHVIDTSAPDPLIDKTYMNKLIISTKIPVPVELRDNGVLLSENGLNQLATILNMQEDAKKKYSSELRFCFLYLPDHEPAVGESWTFSVDSFDAFNMNAGEVMREWTYKLVKIDGDELHIETSSTLKSQLPRVSGSSKGHIVAHKNNYLIKDLQDDFTFRSSPNQKEQLVHTEVKLLDAKLE